MRPTEATIKKLYAFSRNQCAHFPCDNQIVDRKSNSIIGKVCHIKAANAKGPRYDAKQSSKKRHEFDNLILLCANHHDIIDKNPKTYTIEKLLWMKRNHEGKGSAELNIEDAKHSKLIFESLNKVLVKNITKKKQINNNSPGSIQAENVTIKTTKSKIKILPTLGTVGSKPELRGYVHHLIKRYNTYAVIGKSKFSHSVIYKNIITNFGIDWEWVSEQKAPELINFLQEKITNTKQGRINKGKGIKNFSNYEEYIQKYF